MSADSELPSSYSPYAVNVEERHEVVYAAGYEENPGSFGMFAGPTPHVKDLLDSIPRENHGFDACIIRFNLDGSDDVVYRWDEIQFIWKRDVTELERSVGEIERKQCHDCGVREGEFHHPGCDMERCPFCGGQLISCHCCYDLLHIDVSEGTWAYSNGLTKAQAVQWDRMIKAKGLVPHIVYPNMCARCGELWPEMFHVPDEEWAKYIRERKRDQMFCRKCYDRIKYLIDTYAKVPSDDATKPI